MTDTLTVELRASLAWLWQETLDLSTVADASKLEYFRTLADGAAADQADRLWHDERTLAGGANDDLDLTALPAALFGGAWDVSFARLKALWLVNLSTTAGDRLWIDGSVGNACTGPFGGSAASRVEVGPDSPLLWCNKKDGWPVTAGTGDILRIRNPGANAITYRLVLLGSSA